MCDNILHLLTTTVDRMRLVNTTSLYIFKNNWLICVTWMCFENRWIHFQIFWPHILEFLIPEHLTNAVGVVSKCATYLATKEKEEESSGYEVDFEKHSKLIDKLSAD